MLMSIGRSFSSLGRLSLTKSYGNLLPHHRFVSMYTVTDSLYLVTDKPRKIDIDKKTLRFNQEKENSKPIVFMISWFYGKPPQVKKYAELYTKHGMDVLVGNISIKQFLFSVPAAEKFGVDIAKALTNNEDQYKDIFVHIFSAGGGMWGITQRMIAKEPKFGGINQRIIGYVWDSVADPIKTPVAIPFALFPENKLMQSLVRAILKIHLKVHSIILVHLREAINRFKNPVARVPTLVYASKVDKIGTSEFAEEFTECWRKLGIDVTYKCFEDSPHVMHYKTYPDEFLRLLHAHWDKVKLLERK